MNSLTYRIPRLPLASSVILAIAALAGCDNEPAEGKSRASVAEPAPVSAPGSSTAGTTVYRFSEAGSKIGFVGAKVTGKHVGSLGKFSGEIRLVDGNPEKSAVTVEIEMPTLAADDEKLTEHLKSPDFFEVTKYPKARFVSTAVKSGGEKGATHTVTGNLELHGVTKSITFPATIKVHGDGVDVDAEFAINRKDFGVVYPGMPDDLIKDDILVDLEIRAKKAS